MEVNLRKPHRKFYVLVLLNIISQATADFEGKAFKRETDLREYLDYITISIDELKKRVEEQASEIESLKELNSKLTQQEMKSEEREIQMSQTFRQLLNESEHRVINSTAHFKKTLEANTEQTISKSEQNSDAKIELLNLKIQKNNLSLTNLGAKNERQFGQLSLAVEDVNSAYGHLNSTMIILEGQIGKQASALASHVSSTATSVDGIRQQISSILRLQSVVSQLDGNQKLYKSDLVALLARVDGLQAKRGGSVNFYYRRNYEGTTEVVDFGNCLINEECCKHLSSLDNNSGSINTNGACIIAYKDRDCRGVSRVYNRATDFWLDGFYNQISSVRPC